MSSHKLRLNAQGKEPYAQEIEDCQASYLKGLRSDRPILEMWTAAVVFAFAAACFARFYNFYGVSKSDGAWLGVVFTGGMVVCLFRPTFGIVFQTMATVLSILRRVGVPFLLIGRWTFFLFILPIFALSYAIAMLIIGGPTFFFYELIGIAVGALR